MSTTKVAVLGGSAWGGWIALKLLEAGLAVQVIEPQGAGHDQSGSGGLSRIIRATYGGDPLYMDMVDQSFKDWDAYARLWNKPLITYTGLLWLFQTDPAYVTHSLAQMHEFGYALEDWTLSRAQNSYPDFRWDDIQHVFYEPKAGFIPAADTCRLLQQQVIAAGGQWLSLSGKPGSASNDQLQEVLLSNGEKLTADWYVFAAGAWNPLLFPDVFHEKVYLSRHEVSFFSPKQATPQLPIWLDFDAAGTLFYGIPHQEPGIKVSFDERTHTLTDANAERTTNPILVQRNQQYLNHRLPFTQQNNLAHNRVCVYDNTPDGDFILDIHPRYNNVLIASGSSGHGYKMGPAIGQLVAGHLSKQSTLPQKFSLNRLHANTTAQTQFFPS
jgi:glycine/D-amino acid oxidase-like deaminating enzyme